MDKINNPTILLSKWKEEIDTHIVKVKDLLNSSDIENKKLAIEILKIDCPNNPLVNIVEQDYLVFPFTFLTNW